MNESETENISYRVVINDEEQYSIWPIHREAPAGWRDAGFSGARSDCLDYIGKVWTDMRPLSLRRAANDVELEG